MNNLEVFCIFAYLIQKANAFITTIYVLSVHIIQSPQLSPFHLLFITPPQNPDEAFIYWPDHVGLGRPLFNWTFYYNTCKCRLKNSHTNTYIHKGHSTDESIKTSHQTKCMLYQVISDRVETYTSDVYYKMAEVDGGM